MLLMGVGLDAIHRGAPDDRDINDEEEGEQRDVCCPDIPRCGWIPSSNGELIPKGEEIILNVSQMEEGCLLHSHQNFSILIKGTASF